MTGVAKRVFLLGLAVGLPAWISLGAESGVKDPVAQLNELDRRTPLPMPPHMANHQKRNMREHLESVQAIIAANAKRDFRSVEKSARQMGYSDSMAQMCRRMGAGAAGFSERAIAFHKSADLIALAAKKQDSAAVSSALHSTLQHCTACHATYRQEIVTETAYKLLTEEKPVFNQ